jgi:Na+-transporting NADH:ubiquinone oxidoreductase subunit NqrC
MRRKGYIFSGVVFIMFASVLVMAIFYSRAVEQADEANYDKIALMKAVNQIKNVVVIVDHMGELYGQDLQTLRDLIDEVPFLELPHSAAGMCEGMHGKYCIKTTGYPINITINRCSKSNKCD